ncbi:MAG: 30S ribosomal protein S6e [Nanoarchaeota archaeon]|nr:30S ribosomal protein S6e [bacterium]MBU3958094.1 30S ribosomal protein S6e [Nanoarchaeota archaeon]
MMKFVISEPKTRKAFQVEKDAPSLQGMKIGERFDGSVLGLSGFSLQITGGSDKEGFPMRPDMVGAMRKKLLLTSGPGYVPVKKGIKRRKYVRGNMISEASAQINCKIVEGDGNVMEILGIKPKEKAEKPKEEKK